METKTAAAANQAVQTNPAIQEATEHKTLALRVTRKSRPVAFNGHANTDNVTFIDGVDIATGLALEKPLTITEARAKMLGLQQLLINEDFAVKDRYTRDAGNGKTETIETLSEDMFAQGHGDLILELDVLVIPDGQVGDYGYRTKRSVTVDGKTYAAGDLVPYRMVNTMLVQKILGRVDPKLIKCRSLEMNNASIEHDIKLSHAYADFKVITGEKYDCTNPEHQKIMLSLLK